MFMLIVALIIISSFIVLMARNTFPLSRDENHPPSPYCLPIFGNMFCLKRNMHKKLQEISRKLGPICTIWIGQKPFYVSSTYDSAHKLLVESSIAVTNRPRRTIGKMYSDGFKGIILANYEKEYKELRTLIHSAFRAYLYKNKKIEDIIMQECMSLKSTLATKMTSGSVDICGVISCSVVNVITGILFGERYSVEDKEFLELQRMNDDILHGITLAPLYEALPFLKYVPCRTFLQFKKALLWRDEVISRKIKEHENSTSQDSYRDVTASLLTLAKEGTSVGKYHTVSNDQIKIALSDFYIAGSETSALVIQWVLLYLTIYSDIQARVQKELDLTLGERSFPTLADKPNLPFTLATIYETLRIAAPSPLGLPHVAKEDIEIDKYHIKQGSTIIFNIFAIHHDPDKWRDPCRFYPDRFLDKDGQFDKKDRSFMPFSLGIRACIGQKIATEEIFLILAFLLKSYQFEREDDKTNYSTEGIFSATLKPKPFKVKLRSRQFFRPTN